MCVCVCVCEELGGGGILYVFLYVSTYVTCMYIDLFM